MKASEPLGILYRDHRGSFDDSMSTVISVRGVDEIITHLNKGWPDLSGDILNIKFEHYGLDSRNNWDTYIVMVEFNNEPGKYLPVGWTNANLIS